MGLIPQSVIDDVLARTDILEVVRQYVTLKRAGSNFKGLCPFHSEKTPSFNVHAGKGIYKCFGCGAGGNVLNFLMEIEGWSFPEAVRTLAERHGIEIPEESDEEREEANRRRDAKKLYVRIMDIAHAYFTANLWNERGRAARHYLQERGVDDATAKVFGLGYAPDGWQNLLDEMARHDIPAKWVERAGLALPRRSGDGFYDRFRHRIMFPVIDIWGKTLAFGGRVLASNDDGPKYINSPETTFYTKGHHLYGLYAAKQAIQKTEYALLVEGNFDVVSLRAQGVDVAVAPMGTALTSRQAQLLSRYSRRVYVAFDGDQAGQEAALRCLPALEAAGIEARVVEFDETDDPDSFVRRYGAEAFEAKIEAADDLVTWAINRVLPAAERGKVHENLQGLEKAGEILGQVQNDVAREHYAQEISRRLAIEPRLLSEYIQRPKIHGERVRKAVLAAHQPMELERAEFGILAVLLDHPEWLDNFFVEEYDNLLNSEELAGFLRLARDQYRDREHLDTPILLEHIEHPAFRQTVENALFMSEELIAPEKSRRYYEDCVRTLKRNWADRTLAEITAELERTDFMKEREQYQALAERKKQVEQFKRSMESAE